MYNTISEEKHKEAKLSALKNLIRFAADARLLEFLQSFIASAPTWATKWSLTPEEAGSLYLLFANCMEKCGALEESQGFLIRYLTTLETASEGKLVEARPWAKQAALNFIKAPAVSQRSNLSRLVAVRNLCARVCLCLFSLPGMRKNSPKFELSLSLLLRSFLEAAQGDVRNSFMR